LSVDGRSVPTISPGKLATNAPNCRVGSSGAIARCAIGSGQAIVIADADFLNADPGAGGERESNLELLLQELQRLER